MEAQGGPCHRLHKEKSAWTRSACIFDMSIAISDMSKIVLSHPFCIVERIQGRLRCFLHILLSQLYLHTFACRGLLSKEQKDGIGEKEMRWDRFV